MKTNGWGFASLVLAVLLGMVIGAFIPISRTQDRLLWTPPTQELRILPTATPIDDSPKVMLLLSNAENPIDLGYREGAPMPYQIGIKYGYTAAIFGCRSSKEPVSTNGLNEKYRTWITLEDCPELQSQEGTFVQIVGTDKLYNLYCMGCKLDYHGTMGLKPGNGFVVQSGRVTLVPDVPSSDPYVLLIPQEVLAY